MKRVFLPAILLLMTATGASADQGNPSATAATGEASAPVKKPRKICREDSSTGSLFKKETCMTQAEWDAEAAAAKDSMDKWGRQSSGRYTGGGADGGGGARSGVGIGGM